MTSGGNDLSGLPADNALDEPASRRGPGPLPLKPGQWNAVKLAVSGGRVAIELNGQAVFERALEPSLGRQFGLFHYKDQTSAQVRNVVLKGNWPESIPDRLRTDLAAVSPSAIGDEAIRRARHAIVGEGLFALEAGDVVAQVAVARAGRALRHAGRLGPAGPRPSDRPPRGRLHAVVSGRPASDPGGAVRAPAIELVKSREGGGEAGRAGRAGRGAQGRKAMTRAHPPSGDGWRCWP